VGAAEAMSVTTATITNYRKLQREPTIKIIHMLAGQRWAGLGACGQGETKGPGRYPGMHPSTQLFPLLSPVEPGPDVHVLQTKLGQHLTRRGSTTPAQPSRSTPNRLQEPCHDHCEQANQHQRPKRCGKHRFSPPPFPPPHPHTPHTPPHLTTSLPPPPLPTTSTPMHVRCGHPPMIDCPHVSSPCTAPPPAPSCPA
jgi:hypothetical protein